MIKVIKEKLPKGCIYVEKLDVDPMICPIENKGLKLALRFLEGSNGTSDESYVIIDKKTIDPMFWDLIKRIISLSSKSSRDHKIRFNEDVSSIRDDEEGKLINLDLNEDYSIIGEKVAGKLTNLSFSEIKNILNFSRFDSDDVITVKSLPGPHKPFGEKGFFDSLDKRNERLRKWNIQNKKFLEENNIPYAPEEKRGFVEGLKEAHSATSSISGILGDVTGTIDAIDKIQSWWEKYKTNKAFKREEEISRKKVFERNRLSSMFLKSRLKKVESDGFESLSVLTNIYNMGFSNILNCPNYFRVEFLKLLLPICSICVANALPPNKIIGSRMSLGQMSTLLNKLENKYGSVI